MSYQHILVAVAATPESHTLIQKAVSIVKPYSGEITLITAITDPELYNQFAGMMLDNVRELMQEEISTVLQALRDKASYPIKNTLITYGDMGEQVVKTCQQEQVDLVLCGIHNQTFLRKFLTSAKSIIECSEVDVLLVPLPFAE